MKCHRSRRTVAQKCLLGLSFPTAQLLCSPLPRPSAPSPTISCHSLLSSHQKKTSPGPHYTTSGPRILSHQASSTTCSALTMPCATMRPHTGSTPLLIQSCAPPPYHPYSTSPALPSSSPPTRQGKNALHLTLEALRFSMPSRKLWINSCLAHCWSCCHLSEAGPPQ